VGRLTTRFNDALRRQATAVGAEVVDLYEVSRDELPRRPELVGRDGYHPSDVGYERWAELMWQGIERRIRHGGGARAGDGAAPPRSVEAARRNHGPCQEDRLLS